MTPGRIRRPGRTRAVVIASAVAVLVAAGLMWAVVRVASDRPDRANLGSRTFEVGKASALATAIRRDGPFLFKDPLTSGAGRELYLQHLGDEARKGWVAIEAYAPGAPRQIRCVLRWDTTRSQFTDPCGGASFPADGTGLTTYPAVVTTKGRVEVDLRSG